MLFYYTQLMKLRLRLDAHICQVD